MTIRVVIVDDQDLVRDGLSYIVDAADDMQAVATYQDGAGLLAALGHGMTCDVALVDIRMPGIDGITTTREVRALYAQPRVIMLTTFDDEELIIEAIDAGAAGYVLKRAPSEELTAAIRAVATGDALLTPSVTQKLLDVMRRKSLAGPAKPPPALTNLTGREREVLTLLGKGLSNAEIAATLFLSESTVKTHVGNVLTKTGARDRSQAVITAFRAGLVSTDG